MAGQWTAWQTHKSSHRRYRLWKNGDRTLLHQWDSEIGAVTNSQGKAISAEEVYAIIHDVPPEETPRYIERREIQRETGTKREAEALQGGGILGQKAGAPAQTDKNDRDPKRERRPSEREPQRSGDHDPRNTTTKNRADSRYHREGRGSESGEYQLASRVSRLAIDPQNTSNTTRAARPTYVVQTTSRSGGQAQNREPAAYSSLPSTNYTSGNQRNNPGAIFPRNEASVQQDDPSSIDVSRETTKQIQSQPTVQSSQRDNRTSSTNASRDTTRKEQTQPVAKLDSRDNRTSYADPSRDTRRSSQAQPTARQDTRTRRLSSTVTSGNTTNNKQSRGDGNKPKVTNIQTSNPQLTAQQRTLDKSYKIREAKFFKPGVVFCILWHENMGSASQGKTELSTAQYFGERIYSTVRRMIVIQAGSAHSICVPINSYGGQGCLKSGLTRTEVGQHTMAYMVGNVPEVDPEERSLGMLKEPIGIEMVAGQTLRPSSRIRFDKIYTVEHGCKVKYIGNVQASDLPSLSIYFNQAFGGS